jgi:hypothetical protein
LSKLFCILRICLLDRVNLRSEDDSFMLSTLKSRAKLNNGIEILRLGLGVYQSPPGEITLRAIRYALKIGSSSLQRSGTATKNMIRRFKRVRRACGGSGYRTYTSI